MSGHSKWAQIRRQKAVVDKKKGQIFSKLARAITIAVKEGGGGDPSSNFKLRVILDKAKTVGMPNDNVQRAINKATGAEGGGTIEEVIYEGYGPFGTAFLIEAATDNKNRTVNNIKHIFTKHAGNLSASGGVSWQFETKGQILVERTANDMSDIELAAIEAGAEDVRESGEGLEIYTGPLDLHRVKGALEQAGAKVATAEIIKESNQGVDLSD
jgi:YebC/PmpR family DNA-binding regulatory protein